MQYICSSCFIRPGGIHADPGGEAPDLMVCAVAANPRPQLLGNPLSALLRCQACGRALQVELPHLAWYGV